MSGMAITSLGLILFSVFIIVLGIVKVHTLPGQVAEQRGHPQVTAIEVCSLLGLLVFPLWMFALVWAYAGAIGVPLQDRSDIFGRPKESSAAAAPEPTPSDRAED